MTIKDERMSQTLPSDLLRGRTTCCRRIKTAGFVFLDKQVRMYLFLTVAFLSASSLAYPVQDHYSFSPSVGRGDGHSFDLKGDGRITAVRIWEHTNAYITGIQLRFGYIWSTVAGKALGEMTEMQLFDNERIIQVSGKFYIHNYIYQLFIQTSRGRFLVSGQPVFTSFSMSPAFEDGELILLSGRYNHWGITALAAHWGVVKDDHTNSTSSNNGTL